MLSKGMGIYDYKIKGSTKRFADVMCSMTTFERKVIFLSAKVLLPYSKWVSASLFMDMMF